MKDFTDIVSNLATVVGLFLGGFWAVFHFANGRVFNARLTLTGTAHFLHTHAGDYIVCSVTVKNVGLSAVQLSKSDVVIRELAGDGRKHARLGGGRILLPHEWVEPGVLLNEQTAIPVPLRTAVVLAEFRVIGYEKKWFRCTKPVSFSFTCSTIAGMTPHDHPQEGKE